MCWIYYGICCKFLRGKKRKHFYFSIQYLLQNFIEFRIDFDVSVCSFAIKYICLSAFILIYINNHKMFHDKYHFYFIIIYYIKECFTIDRKCMIFFVLLDQQIFGFVLCASMSYVKHMSLLKITITEKIACFLLVGNLLIL